MFHRNIKLMEVLSRIAGSGEEASVLLDAYLTTPYASLAKLKWKTRQIERGRSRARSADADRRAFSVFLSRLQRDGLIKREGMIWHILAKGTEKLELLRERVLPDARYVREKNEGNATASIIIFDVPEIERRKRAWLRSVLVNLECVIIQKSVWLSHTPLPRAFIKDLHDMRMAKYVHIFGVTKRGTLSSIFTS